MVDPTLEHEYDGLSSRTLCASLFGKYAVLFVYGVWAAIVEIPTFVTLADSTFAALWASTVAVSAALAALGVARTWMLGRFRLEKWSTAIFILGFLSYSVALIGRAIFEGDAATGPLALIPAALCILPTIRYYKLVRRGHAARRRANGASA